MRQAAVRRMNCAPCPGTRLVKYAGVPAWLKFGDTHVLVTATWKSGLAVAQGPGSGLVTANTACAAGNLERTRREASAGNKMASSSRSSPADPCAAIGLRCDRLRPIVMRSAERIRVRRRSGNARPITAHGTLCRLLAVGRILFTSRSLTAGALQGCRGSMPYSAVTQPRPCP